MISIIADNRNLSVGSLLHKIMNEYRNGKNRRQKAYNKQINNALFFAAFHICLFSGDMIFYRPIFYVVLLLAAAKLLFLTSAAFCVVEAETVDGTVKLAENNSAKIEVVAAD